MQQLPEPLLAHPYFPFLRGGQRKPGEISRGQSLQVEAAVSAPDHQTAVIEFERNFCFRKGAADIEQLPGGNSDGEILLQGKVTGGGTDLYFQIGGNQGQCASRTFEQDVGQDRKRVFALHNAGYSLEWFE